MHQGEQIISVLGLRRDESHNRASIPIAKADERYAKAGNRHGTTMMTWHPIADWTSSEPGLSFWNNEDGFGSLARATVFSETEAAKFDLPIADDQPEWLAMPAPLRL